MFDRRISGIILFWILALVCQAQETLNSKEVEEKSYQLLLDKNWGALIQLGQMSLDNHIDYFYLRLRIGIAWYEQGHYRQAIQHFEKALEFNSEDAVAQEYYYYSLLFAGQFDESKKYASIIAEPLRSKLGVDKMIGVNLLYAEMGPKISSRSDLYTNAFYFQAGLNHSVGKKFSVSHIYTYYGQNLSQGPFSQHQYYITANIPLAKGWSLSPAFHLVGQKLDSTISLQGGQGKPPRSSNITVSSSSVVGSLAIAKRFSFADVAYASMISNVEGTNQYIQQFTLTVYPSGSNNFYLGSIAYYHWEQKYGGTFALNPYVSFKPTSRLTLQALYFTNKNANLIERNGYFVNNSPELTTSRWSGIVEVSFNRHVSMYGIYMLENKKTAADTFSYSTFILGLKIIP